MRDASGSVSHRVGLVVLLAMVGAGCGDAGSPSNNANAANLCDEIAEVACYNMYQCCSEGEIENFLDVSDPRTQAQCREDISRQCVRQVAPLEAALAAGRVRFDPVPMNACLDAIVAPSGVCATVEDMLPWQEACMTSAWSGAVEVGSECRFSYECAGAVTGEALCGSNRKCQSRPHENEACINTACATGLSCEANVCRRLPTENQQCTANFQCAEHLFCDTSTINPQCKALRATGETCTSDQACVSRDCLPGTCSNTGSICFVATDCGGRCADSQQFCSQDSSCSTGTCNVGGGSCFGPNDCGPGITCVFPVPCVLGACSGDIVCSSSYVTVDYCTGALNNLPI